MDESREKQIDSIVYETNDKLSAIAQEMKNVNFSTLDDKTKKEKLEVLRVEFQKMLDEQQRRVLEITKK
ncbi:MAG: hypothetical protein OEL56_05290 [Nitrosopumilus sp.]|nr:hypothetical protein [Nitrosopumilus sp.]MDH3489844.1 hypothetical protein [Nitrosopumilus sp.]MDH3516667.1 hypothetical protein [Nitrosopumilus sp.]MDH3564675.1 hypothetical protein [Nitrosopumilus sp.]MDH5418274.1 hypothetical protein [Nitrosopumilus sp.]